MPDIFVIEPHELYCWHMREVGREGQAQDHSIQSEIHLNLREILLKALRISQVKCQACAFSELQSLLLLLYPFYLYNKASHSLCDSFICVQFKGTPSEI